MDTKKRNFKEVFGKVECYAGNVAELAGEVNDELIEEDGDFIEMNLTGVVKLIQVMWNKFKETVSECEGKTIIVKMPKGIAGYLLSAGLEVIGIKL